MKDNKQEVSLETPGETLDMKVTGEKVKFDPAAVYEERKIVSVFFGDKGGSDQFL